MQYERKIPEMKPLFRERMEKLLGDEMKEYEEILKIQPVRSIRCNTIKVQPEVLKKQLEDNGWKITQPWEGCPEVMIVEGRINTELNEVEPLAPGELGRAIEHMLGYYYIQELASMLPIISLKPKENENFLDLCAAPGSKTTQAAAMMKNTGNIVANEVSMGRLRILASNLEKCGTTNTMITRKDGVALCARLVKFNPEIKFDRVLVDAPCSGEGTLRSTLKTYSMWNIKSVMSLSILQKQLFKQAFRVLKVGGEMIYSTCTHAPEEDEKVVSDMLEKLGDAIEIIPTELPVKTREGITEWEGETYNEKVKLCSRVYPQDNNTEGFFVSKFRKVKELEQDIGDAI